MADLGVGSLVIATRTTGVCAEGERGVCYEVYRLEGRPGYSFIFELGRFDGFSPDEVDLMLQPLGEVCTAVVDYSFTNVTKLVHDYEAGVFDPALPVAHLARRCIAEGRRLTPVAYRLSYTCPLCGAVSYNPTDIAERYCGRCHLFVDQLHELRRAAVLTGATHECGEWRTPAGSCALCDRRL